MRIVLVVAETECAKCRKAKEVLGRIAGRFPDVEVTSLAVTDPAAAPYGIVMSPTTILDGTIIASGRPPNEAKLAAFLEANAQAS
jgi:hypothetical protein